MQKFLIDEDRDLPNNTQTALGSEEDEEDVAPINCGKRKRSKVLADDDEEEEDAPAIPEEAESETEAEDEVQPPPNKKGKQMDAAKVTGKSPRRSPKKKTATTPSPAITTTMDGRPKKITLFDDGPAKGKGRNGKGKARSLIDRVELIGPCEYEIANRLSVFVGLKTYEHNGQVRTMKVLNFRREYGDVKKPDFFDGSYPLTCLKPLQKAVTKMIRDCDSMNE